MTRATAATLRPRATITRDRATRSLTPSPAMLPRYVELVGLSPEGALQLPDLLAEILLRLALVLARERGLAALEDLVAPRVVEGLGDVVLPADVPHRSVAPHPGEDDLQLLLRAAVLPLLCQLDLLGGRAAILGAIPDASSGLRPSSASGLIQPRWVSTRGRGPGQWLPGLGMAEDEMLVAGDLCPPGMHVAFSLSLPWIPVKTDTELPMVFEVPLPGASLVGQSVETELHHLIRVGDEIRLTEELLSLREEKQTALGPGHLVTVGWSYFNQDDRLCAVDTVVSFRFTPRTGESDLESPRALQFVPGGDSSSMTLPITYSRACQAAASTWDWYPDDRE